MSLQLFSNCKLNGLDDAAGLDIAKFGPRMVLPKVGIEIGERVKRGFCHS